MKKSYKYKNIQDLIKMAVPPMCDKYILFRTVDDETRVSGKKVVIREWITFLN